MRERHVVLRSPRPTTREVFRGARALPAEVEAVGVGLQVEIAEIERREIPALTRQADVVSIAPVMPVKLIAPVSVSQQVTPAWGIQAVGADTSPFSGQGIVVAVLDTGIDASHLAFSGVNLIERDFTGDGNGDQEGHGTHCAGTIFGRDTGGQRIGIAPGVTQALIGKVLGSQGGSTEQIVTAVLWAVENGANVISMSLGIDFPGFVDRLVQAGLPPALVTSRALEAYRANVQFFEDLASLVQSRGGFLQATVIVAAAGNESLREQNPDFEIAVSPPAVAEGMISVAALSQGGQGLSVAPFSNTGANVSAPGVGITSARSGGGLATMSGTSMATPHVAGVAALWAQKIAAAGALNPFQLKARLLGSAVTAGLEPGFDPFDVGLGLIRAPQV